MEILSFLISFFKEFFFKFGFWFIGEEIKFFKVSVFSIFYSCFGFNVVQICGYFRCVSNIVEGQAVYQGVVFQEKRKGLFNFFRSFQYSYFRIVLKRSIRKDFQVELVLNEFTLYFVKYCIGFLIVGVLKEDIIIVEFLLV